MTTYQENILIVDDEEMIRWVLNKKLTKEGYNCEESENAEQALQKLESNPIELAILDINMPGKKGNRLLPQLQTIFPGTAVIMSSAVTDRGIIAQCIRDGAQDYIRKPFSLNEVSLSVGRALEKRRLEIRIQQYKRRLRRKAGGNEAAVRKSFLNPIEKLVGTLEANDQYTAGHSRRTTEIAMLIGKEFGLSPSEMDDLLWGALLHDVGKIAIDPDILNKPGELTHEEYRHIMTHAIIGPKLVKPMVNQRVVEIISHHHDHYDGSGLDQMVSGADIPLGARILAVADAFDAMTSDRPYRAAMSEEEAIEEIKLCSDTQFDPVITDVFLTAITTNKPMAAVSTSSPKSTSTLTTESNPF